MGLGSGVAGLAMRGGVPSRTFAATFAAGPTLHEATGAALR
jgi:hypothetical protein